MVATIRDVADAAGVSASTVSRAYGRPEKVDSVTRERVLRAAERLGYRPNRAARALITGRTGTVGVVVPDLENPFFPGILKGAQARAHALGLAPLIADAQEDPATELALVRTLLPEVDGLVMCSSRLTDEQLREAAAERPVVLVNRTVPGVPAITLDNPGGMRRAVAHLRALRHQRVGYLAGPATSHSDAERRDALATHLAAAGGTLVPVGSYEPSVEGGRAAADDVLLADVTAVVAYNDVMALGLLARLAGYGVRVPEELSVVGVDDIPMAAMFTPALTTVSIPRERAGAEAVGHLNDLLGGGDVPPPPLLPTGLAVRGTTGRASR